MPVKCSATAKSGEPCASPVLPDSDFCWIHDPASAEARREAARRGGRGKSNRARAARAMTTYSIEDVRAVLSTALRDLLAGKLDVGVATAAASLCRVIITANEKCVLESRLAELERRAGIPTGKQEAP